MTEVISGGAWRPGREEDGAIIRARLLYYL